MNVKRYRDPVHGFIELREQEQRIVDSAPFQRLRHIKQLALTDYVYHGAEHTRFGHSLGVLHLATRAFCAAISKSTYRFRIDDTENRQHIEWLEQILRLIALTHDLGHAPFSHAAEDLFPLKEADAHGKKKPYKHEDLTEAIVKATPIADIIADIGSEYKGRFGEDYDITPMMICDIYSGKNPGANSEFTLLKTFMDSELDCDKMDYLLRDSLYCGVAYGKFDLERLITSLLIANRPGEHNTGAESKELAPFLCVESGSVNAFEEFVLARYFMFVQVYFHRTRRFFDIMLSEALRQCLPERVFPIDTSQYLTWDDTKVLELLKIKSSECAEARAIVERRVWTCVYQTKTHPHGDGLTGFQMVENMMKTKFGSEVFKENFRVDRSADKLPHKIIPRKYAIDDEEVIAIFDKKSNRLTTISDESAIISNLTDRINIQRIYAHPDISDAALAEVRKLLGTEAEDNENE